jgi:3-methyladenine DNA glycosylase AlkD
MFAEMVIHQYSTDERNFVKKAVNWALRKIGNGNKRLQKKVIVIAKEIKKTLLSTAKWIAMDTIRELTNI